MKITDRIKGIAGIESAYWDSQRNRLVVYYSDTTPKDTIKINVAGAIGEANLQQVIDEITLISLSQE